MGGHCIWNLLDEKTLFQRVCNISLFISLIGFIFTVWSEYKLPLVIQLFGGQFPLFLWDSRNGLWPYIPCWRTNNASQLCVTGSVCDDLIVCNGKMYWVTYLQTLCFAYLLVRENPVLLYLFIYFFMLHLTCSVKFFFWFMPAKPDTICNIHLVCNVKFPCSLFISGVYLCSRISRGNNICIAWT